MNTQILNVALAVALSGSALSAHAASYAFTDLGTLLGGNFSQAAAINNAGQVAGWSSTTAGDSHATVWNGTTATDLGTLGVRSQAFAINDAGQVAGVSYTTAFDTATGIETVTSHATVWNGTTTTHLGTPGLSGPSSEAYAINDAGLVAGWTNTTSEFSNHATVWNGATTTYLDTPGGTYTYASAINTAGRVAGVTLYGGPSHATVWNGTTATDLGTLATYSGATAINDAGLVVGWSQSTIGSSSHATLWNGATATDLGTLGGNSSYAAAINEAGVIVGTAYTTSGARHATLWNGVTAADLNSLLDASTVSAGWVLSDATGINDNGWIVGNASNDLLGIYVHAFLLTPVPEAETWAMMLAGLGLVGWTSLRRRSTTSNSVGVLCGRHK